MYSSIAMPTDIHGARTVIDYAHHEIHSGSHFTASVYEADVDNGSTLTLLLRTPATGEMHLTGLVKSSLGGAFTWQEGANCTGGSAIVAYNNHRQSTRAATMVVRSDPTVTSAGTIMLQTDVGKTGNPTQAAGGNFAARQEWILNVSTDYVLQFTSLTNDAAVTLLVEWYEES